MKIVEIKEDVFGKRKKLNKEIGELLENITTWPLDKAREVHFDEPAKSLLSILKRELDGKRKVFARMVETDPKRWYVKVSKARRKRRSKIENEAELVKA